MYSMAELSMLTNTLHAMLDKNKKIKIYKTKH